MTNVWLWVWGEYFLPLFCDDVESPDDVFDFVVGLPGDVFGYEATGDGVLIILVLDEILA